MTRNQQRFKVAAALLVLFASGLGVGWFGHRAQHGSAAPPPASPAAVVAGPWTARAMDTLRDELKLTAEQESLVRPLLESAAGRMDLDRERALFQLHLQVLKVHDELRPHLRPDQLPALDRMRARLQRDIKRRFAAFLDDPAQPATDL